jgi:cellulose synthase/poly-beta-1,6-N-acetylglucosamine synthase-like glycosyltransferase
MGGLSGLLIPLISPLASFLQLDAFSLAGAIAIIVLLALCVQLSISISGLQRQVQLLKQTEFLVAVPALNEAASIRQVLLEIRKRGFEAVVIDDGSTDDTATIARQCQSQVVSLPLNVMPMGNILLTI